MISGFTVFPDEERLDGRLTLTILQDYGMSNKIEGSVWTNGQTVYVRTVENKTLYVSDNFIIFIKTELQLNFAISLTILVHAYYVYSSSLSTPISYTLMLFERRKCSDITLKGPRNLDDKTYFDVYVGLRIPHTAMDTRVRWYQSQIDIR